MNEWKKLSKRYYGKDVCKAFGNGIIDFSPESMNDVEHGDFRSYEDYLDVQMRSCGKSRRYFEICYFHVGGACADFKGQILRFDAEKGKVLFNRIMVDGIFSDGGDFYGKEDHVWMDISGFEGFEPGNCVQFHAEIYRYLRKSNGKLLDYSLRKPEAVSRIDSYEVPTDEQLIDQQIDQLICETCRYYDHCFLGMCIADEQERKERFETLKNFQPGKFTPFTVVLAYELEYRVLLQHGGIRLDKNDPNYPVVKKLADICSANPIHYVGDAEEALYKMVNIEKPRLYIE